MDQQATGNKQTRIAIVVGEHSGDALGGKLMRALKADASRMFHFVGVGGEAMEAEGFQTEFPMSDVAVMGPVAILKRLPLLVRRVHQAVDAVLAADPDVVVIIDSPEFTHPIAKRIKKRRPDLPVINYVCPSVWAWRQGRAKKMSGYVDHVLALLPFEPEALERLHGPPGTYIGHSLAERLESLRSLDPAPFRERLGLKPDQPTIVVLPGSRPSEVGRLMDPFGGAMQRLSDKGLEPQVIIPVVDSVRGLVEQKLTDWTIKPHLVSGEADKFAAFRAADAALAASGTVTLELAVVGTPMVVGYIVEPLATILRYLLKIHSVVLPNLMLGGNPFPEFLQEYCTPDNLAEALSALLDKSSKPHQAQQEALARVPAALGVGAINPSQKAAEIVLEFADGMRTQ